MKTIVVKTQAELDALPAKFEEWTCIEIRSTDRICVKIKRENSSVVAFDNSRVVARENSSVEARENSSVEARENSSVEARENSSVEARENSSVEAYQFAVVLAFSFMALRLYDWSCVRLKRKGLKFKTVGKSVTKIRDYNAKEISFDTWLKRGYVVADGITRKLVERSKSGEIDVFKAADFKGEESYVARKGKYFSHGETLPEALADLDYKINGRDTKRFKEWKRDEVKSVSEMIVAYRAITGACAMGVRDFIKSVPKLPEAVSPEMVIELIGENYGAREFREFFK